MEKDNLDKNIDLKKPTKIEYVLRWGNATAFWALVYSQGLGLLFLGLLYHLAGDEWFRDYYYPILGYYVVSSICQSHYFRASIKNPSPKELWRQLLSIALGIGLYYLNEVLFDEAFDIPEDRKPTGHFSWILHGFFMFGFDDTYFLGGLAAFLPFDWLKAVFWFFVTYVVWLFFIVSSVMGNLTTSDFDPLMINWWLASMQWVIMCEMFQGLHLGEYLDTFRFKNRYTRGFITMFLNFCVGFLISALLYCIVYTFLYEPGHIEPAAIWHHIMYIATCPLNATIPFGLYSTKFAGKRAPKTVRTSTVTSHTASAEEETTTTVTTTTTTRVVGGAGGWSELQIALARALVVVIWTMGVYFYFQLIIANTNILGDYSWIHEQTLIFNFTTSILMITHHWFAKRWGFMKKLPQPDPLAETLQECVSA